MNGCYADRKEVMLPCRSLLGNVFYSSFDWRNGCHADPNDEALAAAIAEGAHFRALYLANKRKFVAASVLLLVLLVIAIVLLAVLLSIGACPYFMSTVSWVSAR